jgi:Fur family ferric uptake transcriptional regulator
MARHTKQRDAIQQVFEETARPLTAQEVHQRAEEISDGVGIATIYRNLKKYVKEGKLTVVELPGEPSRYEPTDLDHHHHFQCLECERVFDVQGCADVDALAPDNFSVTHHEILLYGQCAACG